MKKELLLFCAIMLMGLLDWLTTVTGVLFFRATEVNPLLFGLTKSSMLIFSAAKLSAVTLAAAAFYKASAINQTNNLDWQKTKKFLNGGYSVALLALTIVVANNMMTVFKL